MRSVRVSAAVLMVLAGLALLAEHTLAATTQRWFERDAALRADLVASVARPALLAHWAPRESGALRDLLETIARDERITAVAACDADGSMLARTDLFPEAVSCSGLAPHLRQQSGTPAQYTEVVELPEGPLHLSAVPVGDGTRTLGFLVLVHDLSLAERRGDAARKFVLVAFFILAVAGAMLGVVARRMSWRSWTFELRRLARGEGHRPEFRPLVRDVQELVDRLRSESEQRTEHGSWTAERLRQTLAFHLRGEKVVVLSNREPYIHERAPDGRVAVLHPASGLVTALEPVMRACSGTWVAHGSGAADRETADAKGRIAVPPGKNDFTLRRVWLTRDEERGYYYGFSNEGLWPLCHIADARPSFRKEDWDAYVAVNERFANAVCDEADAEDPIVLVQDYHFALAPRMIRERLPRATVLTFWHVPWPNSERFSICPWGPELLEGLLGSSILGFHTQLHCNNFCDAVDRLIEARIDRERHAVVFGGRSTLIRPYPISIEWPDQTALSSSPPAECRAQVLRELDLPAGTLLGVGVDRLDYTKGIEERLLAVERLLERHPQFRGRFTFVQLAAPSRTVIERYRRLNQTVEELAARINGRFGAAGYRPVVLLRAHHERPEVFRYLRAADVCYVSSLHDGMNLVAKEFVAARDDERGVLVLSHFTGAARELTEALIVNPYDLDQASAALATGLTMPVEEQRDRLRSMRALVAEFNVYRWAGRMLEDAARLRDRERLAGRLSELRTGRSA
ncbi:MAG: trehalose-6-phosphate synthase [Deltaproteobacteria bacterium]|nr:trehalose-6-phosphate synthase [Deltaproteobacteria bacterium]